MVKVGLLKRALRNEYKHFKKLSKQGQKFALAIFVYNAINPIFLIFINAFLWRQTHDVLAVALFNLAMFCTLPIGFYLNGQLLKHYSVKKLYFSGAIIRALLIATLIFYPMINNVAIILFGIGYGLASGLFWANKNLLTVEITSSSNRIYFSSLDFLSQTANNIVIPAVIGWLLIFGPTNHLYTSNQGYYAVAVALIIFSSGLGFIIKQIKVETPQVSNIILTNATTQWNFARGITALLGMISGITTFLPALLVLQFIGKEDTLGVIQSLAAIISGIIMYAIARSFNTQYRIQMISLSLVALFISTLILVFFFNPTGIFIFISLMTIAHQILMVETSSIILDLVDRETTVSDQKYKYVFDLEMVLNVGRVTGIMFFVFYIKTFSTAFAMQFTPLFFAIALGAIVILAKYIEDRKDAYVEQQELAESYASGQQ